MIKFELTESNTEDVLSFFYENDNVVSDILQSMKGPFGSYGSLAGQMVFQYDVGGFYVAEEVFDELENFLEELSD